MKPFSYPVDFSSASKSKSCRVKCKSQEVTQTTKTLTQQSLSLEALNFRLLSIIGTCISLGAQTDTKALKKDFTIENSSLNLTNHSVH